VFGILAGLGPVAGSGSPRGSFSCVGGMLTIRAQRDCYSGAGIRSETPTYECHIRSNLLMPILVRSLPFIVDAFPCQLLAFR